MFDIIKTNYKNFINWILPKTCIYCGQIRNYVCEDCYKKHFIQEKDQNCHVCKERVENLLIHDKCRESTYLDGVFITFKYNKAVEKLIADIKYQFYYSIAEFVGAEMYRKFIQIRNITIDTVVPIPLHRRRLWKRGFNQSELLAKEIINNLKQNDQHYLNLKCIQLIRRNRNTRTQVGLNKESRIKNLECAFEVDNKKFFNEINNVLLIDDVMTTGTTLEECAKVLKNAGIQNIYALVFARG